MLSNHHEKSTLSLGITDFQQPMYLTSEIAKKKKNHLYNFV
jgi:hypothetical protein